MRYLLVFISLCSFSSLLALPQYTARAGRICDNCHSSPFKTKTKPAWKNPKLSKRKCNLSCQSCHVTPGGGGMRTVVGRYYAKNTLPIWGAAKRPYHDQQRDLVDYFSDNSEPDQTVKALAQADEPPPPPGDGNGLPPAWSWADPLVFGTPFNVNSINEQSDYAYDFDRYGDLNADPLVNVAGNFRFAYRRLSNPNIFTLENAFPMQLDAGVAVHPIEHLTVKSTVGVLGQISGDDSTGEPRELDKRLLVRDAFIMTHEWPFQSYALAGTFQPSFGMRIEDHTAPTRRFFEQDLSEAGNSVYGLEVGAAPNYPYINASVFMNQTDEAPLGDATGLGGAVAAGWRDLAWGLGASYMVKRRTYANRGDLDAYNINGYFNLGRLYRPLVITVLGEVSVGRRPRSPNQANKKWFMANFVELNYLLANGINLKVNHHFYDADTRVKDDELRRLGFGSDLTLFPGLRLSLEYRMYRRINDNRVQEYVTQFTNQGRADLAELVQSEEVQNELIIFLHGYF